MKKIVALVTVPGREEAERIARALIEEKLAACCNIIPSVKSFFRWQGKVDEADELLLVIKTGEEKFSELAKRVKELHSYEVPEIIALPIGQGEKNYLRWIEDSI